MSAICYATRGEEIEIYGPFPNGEAASAWGFKNLRQPDVDSWCWQDLIDPLSPYAISLAGPVIDRG